MWSDDGCEEIRKLAETTGVRVSSVCADYFIAHPFFRVSDDARNHSVASLERLVLRAAAIGIDVIVLPVLEGSEIRTADETEQLLDALARPLERAADHRVRIALETDLTGLENLALVRRTHPTLCLCYDTGNATAKGYDIAADVSLLARHLSEIHIKDRTRRGPSTWLGAGDADFAAFFKAAHAARFDGPLILETPAGDEPIAAAKAHLAFVKEHTQSA